MVKFAIVQVLRLCTGRTAHSGRRGIALLFLDHDTRRGWGVSVTPQPLFTAGKDPVPIVEEAGWAPGPVWTGAENLAPSPGFDPGTVQLVASRYTDWAIRPTNLYVTHANYNFNILFSCGAAVQTRAMASSCLRFLDHTQRRTAFGRTPLDEWSARRRDLFLTTLTTDKHPCSRWDSNPRSQQACGRRPTP